MTTMNPKSIVFDTDSYKVSMSSQYPPGTEYVYSYISSRGGDPESFYIGLQPMLIDVLSKPVTKEEVLNANYFWTAHGEPFPLEQWMYIVEKYNGYLPLDVRGLDEGTMVPANVPMITIVNTDPKCYWLTTWVETAMLRAIWYPTTVATQSMRIRKIIADYLQKSGDVSGLGFKLHDFGSRGVSSNESAMIGGMAHLATGATGTDTAIGILGAMKWYNADPSNTAWSIPASEHSTITSWGRGSEALAYDNMIIQFSKPGSIYAVVSDSYDIYNAVENIWGNTLKEKIISSGGTLVIRPDSGDPLIVLPKLLVSLEKNFGFIKNEKGYKVLNNVWLIWGDGICELTIQSILRMVVDNMGFSADNIAFGMGGQLLQKVNRDDLKFAMKCSAACINGVWVDVYKDPVDAPDKKSLAGIFAVNNGVVSRINYGESTGDLKPRFRNGVIFNKTIFEEIRQRANSVL